MQISKGIHPKYIAPLRLGGHDGCRRFTSQLGGNGRLVISANVM